ncbi:MAG: HlyD family efflux transporter periplasmic adaptor subunit, partial [Clostridia bacterium]|nr:HlyD family efflux transporter periplasmic adaptor subunit [Clostridia bacterium]
MNNENNIPENVKNAENTAQNAVSNEVPKPKKGRKKKKKIGKIIIIVLLVIAAAVFALFKFGIIGNTGKLSTSDVYSVYIVSRRDIQQILTGTGTLQPQDSYNVTALSSGEIIEDFFEEGDEVTEDQLLFKIDSSNLESSLKRAQNTYKNALQSLNDLYEEKSKLNIVSDYSGRIYGMDAETGDEIMTGSAFATVLDRDRMLIDVPFMQDDALNISKGDSAVLYVADTFEEIYGTVEKVSAGYEVNSNGVKTTDVTIIVNNPGAITESTSATAEIGEYTCTQSGKFRYNVNKTVKAETSGKVAKILKNNGDYVNEGDVIAVLESDSLNKNIEKAQNTLEEAKDSLSDAKDAFENYEIKAPISGTVIKKNYKKGEKIGGSGSSSGGNVVAVIYDLSALKFTMSIDELDIDSIKLGQEVNITSDAKSSNTYVGYITQISVEGTTQNGTTVYPVTVTLENYGSDEEGNKLRPGMNIDAEIVLEKSENILAVPVSCVGRGNKVKVVSAEYLSTDENSSDRTKGNRPSFDSENMPSFDSENMPSFDSENMPDFSNGNMPSFDGENMPSFDSENMPDFGSMPGRQSGSSATGIYTTVPNTAEYTEVTVETGISDNDYIEIVSGLNEGDAVIVGSTSDNSFNMSFYGMPAGAGAMGGGA